MFSPKIHDFKVSRSNLTVQIIRNDLSSLSANKQPIQTRVGSNVSRSSRDRVSFSRLTRSSKIKDGDLICGVEYDDSRVAELELFYSCRVAELVSDLYAVSTEDVDFGVRFAILVGSYGKERLDGIVCERGDVVW